MVLKPRAKFGEEIESGLARHAVNVEFSQSPGVIGLGPITGSITRAWVEYSGEEVTEVPEGEYFTVKIDFVADNPGFSIRPWDPGWSTAISAISTGGEVKGCDPTAQYAAHQAEVAEVTIGPMPAHDITLRVKLHGNQDLWTDYGVPDCPPESDW